MDERPVAVSIESEQAVLGGLMLEPAALARIADWLAEDDFVRNDHRAIFRAFTKLAGEGRACDAVTMAEWFSDNGLADVVEIDYIISLGNNTASVANITAYAEIVVEKSRLRRLADCGAWLDTAAREPGRSSADLIAESGQTIAALSAMRSRGGLQPAKLAMKVLFAEMMERYERGPHLLGLPTPWADVNKVLKGLRKSTLYVVGARPSMGKSVFGGQLATFTALRGHRSAFFAVEGSAEELLSRAVACHGDIPYDWIEQPSDQAQDADLYWTRNTNMSALLIESPLLIDDTPYININALMARARREHQRRPIELLVVDHIHDMDHGSGDVQKMRMELGRTVQGGKTLAKEFDCPVVLLAQLSRGLVGRADKRPTLADLRESGEIEQKADVVIFLHREDYYDTPTSKTHLQGVIEVIPAKGRNIKVGETIHLKNRFDRMRMEDWDGPLPMASMAESGDEGATNRFRPRRRA